MFILRRKFLLRLLIGAAIAVPLQFIFADSPSVTAVLTNSEAAVGETVQLQIKVTGSGVRPPRDIQAEGLEINYTGESSQSQITFGMGGMQSSQSVTYTYTILPMKTGKFKIPPQTIEIGGKTLQTQELVLNVTDSGMGSAQSSGRSNPNSARRLAIDPKDVGFIELVVPKRQVYVGEVLRAEIRLGFNTKTPPAQDWDPPQISTQGLTVQRKDRIEKTVEFINGANYTVFTYTNAISATRTGKFEIPPLEERIVALVRSQREPRSQAPRRRFPMDIFDIDPLLNDLNVVEPRQFVLRSEPTTLEVKPLPPNAPANFSGAVGNFTLATEANPKAVQVGDPITVRSTIAGRGNFDRVNAPVIDDDQGWHKYPPSSKFQKDDDVGISGTKTFEMVLSPNEKKQAVPPLAFSYFDPIKEQYVTLHSEPIVVRVEGNALPAASPSAVAAASAQPTQAPADKATTKPQDILYQLTDFGRAQSFTPLYAQPVFWTAQLVPLFALLGFAGWKTRQARIGNREAQRLAALHHEAADLMRKLRRDDASPQEYFAQASRVVQVKTALASRHRGIDPNVVDAETAVNAFGLSETERAQLRRLFARSDEVRYSGAQNGGISPQDRHEVLQLIENLRA